jgi:hypothetical protein
MAPSIATRPLPVTRRRVPKLGPSDAVGANDGTPAMLSVNNVSGAIGGFTASGSSVANKSPATIGDIQAPFFEENGQSIAYEATLAQ